MGWVERSPADSICNTNIDDEEKINQHCIGFQNLSVLILIVWEKYYYEVRI